MKNPHILSAAIHYDDGEEHVHQPKNVRTGFVIGGRRHHNVIAIRGITGIDKKLKNTQGFITSDDRFVDRKEGGEIALAAGQIKKSTISLHSEDLY